MSIARSNFEQSRICIKIPRTWEDMVACRTIEQAGVVQCTIRGSSPKAVWSLACPAVRVYTELRREMRLR
ncbi:uncharacterized protein BDW43DRAFT_260110 [Aspergillus alliaceus]|uniref:uncharacterized protein n=1 Tax=Petromyces alliaceus TaxID=209559 RepID=UPI0012A46CA9|nr:uncharacterized protein BDW43DRAFT_260110 [Aspergillus alliaceus]KAB8238884.1 hypothetical protein BDW43DRAFT_260110 [Aspergillus alliaceus]